MEFQIRVLGPVELRAGERRSTLGSTKERAVLAALAWDAGRAVGVDTLVSRVWDDSPPGKPRDALYAYVSRIRRALHEIGGAAAPLLERRTHTYLLDVDRSAVDLHRYVGLVDRAHAVAPHDDGHEALRLLREAEGLQRGEPMAGLSGTWAADVRAAMDERGLDAATLQARVALRLGRYSDPGPRLASLVEAHPTHEALVELLALALYGSGRTVEAADVLRRFLRRLGRDFGTGPGHRLQTVQQGILNRTPVAELLASAPRFAGAADEDRTSERADNLPHDIEWIGREEEIRRLTRSIAAPGGPGAVVALEAVDGMPGVGKTSLAVHVAHRLREHYPDGCAFLDLRGTHAPADAMGTTEALDTLLHLVGVPEPSIPQHPEALASAWRTALAARRLIVILDNVADADQVRRLLPGVSPSLVILTSRHRLTGIPGIRPVSLDVMPLPDAVRMFRRRVGAERAPTAEASARIVRLCGCLPLAIEIVASRFLSRPSWSAAVLVDRLAHPGTRLLEIRDGHRELVAAFELSYRALTPLQQMVFRRLGAHLGPEFGPHAAAVLSGLSVEDTDRALEGLLACHLIEEPAPHRYRLHDLLREYAQGLATAEDGPQEGAAALSRLLDFYLSSADLADRQAYPFRCRIDPGFPRTAPAPWGTRGDPTRWLVLEGPNLLAVLAWSLVHDAPRRPAVLAHVLAGFLDSEGYLATAEAALRRAVEHWRAAADPRAYACGLLDLCAVSIHAGQYPQASEAAGRALELARAAADRAIEAEALHQLGICHWHSGQYAQAVDRHRAALALRADGPALQQARSLNMLAIALLEGGEHRQALTAFHDVLRKFREVGDRRGEWRALNNLGETHQKLGDPERADAAYRQALALARQVESRVDCATLQMNLAAALLSAGKADQALTLYQEVLPVLRSVGDRRNEAIALHGIGRTLQSGGRLAESITHYTAALAVARRIGVAHEEAETLRDLGIAEHRVGRIAQAARHLQDSLAIAERIQAPVEETETLKALADLRRQQGSTAEAETLRARLLALRAKHGME
ncbi:DNA-binding transcriptional activator of the SARP family [Actinacidiphila yanglinensis]|uniref:DNA-binding transcriptional activator of the SARP family n=1 Tax=Actinacidiphila yanglinensis TaxID=310779 RepID=A0A1H5SV82_9ACTN|nr:tetratricopeptide repeat protein [Actinacidiphila yanglinensis]SEF54445.1 DNA-binding transcriptional activator of the SARP family [Actinacidiphila yanglinensis]